jgi:hypothetical protein
LPALELMFSLCSLGFVPSPTPERLRQLALDALEEVAALAEHGPVRRSWAVRFSLAYLSSLDRMRWRSGEPYREFWRAMAIGDKALRLGGLRSALGTIYAWAKCSAIPNASPSSPRRRGKTAVPMNPDPR